MGIDWNSRSLVGESNGRVTYVEVPVVGSPTLRKIKQEVGAMTGCVLVELYDFKVVSENQEFIAEFEKEIGKSIVLNILAYMNDDEGV